MYRRIVLCENVLCCLIQSCLLSVILHTLPSVVSVSQCPLLSSTFYPSSFGTLHCTVTSFCDRITTATLTVCPLSVSTSHCTAPVILCLYVQNCLLHTVHFVSVPHPVRSLGFVSLCPLLFSIAYQYFAIYCPNIVSLCPQLSSTLCPMSVSTSLCIVFLFCVIMSTALW